MSKATLVPFDAVDYLESEEDIALYLNAILEDGSPMEIAAALGDVARAQMGERAARERR